MSTRDRIALSVPPLLLRLVLAVTFLWAGLGKALTYMSVNPEGAATLSSMGVAVSNASTPPVVIPSGGGAMLTPSQPPLGIVGVGLQAGSGGAGSTNPPFPADGFSKPKDGKDAKPEQPANPTTPPAGDAPKADPPKNPFTPPPATTPAPPAATTPPAPAAGATTQSGPIKTAADFPNPQPVRRVYMLALSVHGAANPPALPAGPGGESRGTKMRLLPGELGQGSRPVYFAFTIAAIEIIGGAMLLLGMLTRLWALALACVMIGAIWMTQIGLAMQGGDAVLGFLPNHPWGDPSKWNSFFLQLSLLGAALAVAFAGSGAFAVDNALFGKRADRAELDE